MFLCTLVTYQLPSISKQVKTQLNVIDITSKRQTDKPIKLTAKLIANALPRTNRYDIKDTTVSGLRLRISPTSRKVFVALGKVKSTNQVRVLTLGDANLLTLDKARELATEFLTKLHLGIDVRKVSSEQELADNKKKITLHDAMEQYLSDRQLKPSTVKDYRYEIPLYCKAFLTLPVQEITEDSVCKWYLRNSHRSTSIDKAFRSLRAILQYQVGLHTITFNPAHAVTIRKLRYKIKPRTRRVESHNITKFVDGWLKLMVEDAINPIQGDFILMLLMSGLRLNECRKLKWSNICYELYTITVYDTKNGSDHTIPLTPLIFDVFQRRKNDNPKENPFIFPAMQGKGISETKHINDCRKTLDKISIAANIDCVRPHDIRRTFTSILDELNISESNIKALLNHNDGTVTRKHYLQSTNIETKRSNLWEVGKFLESSVTIRRNGSNWKCLGTLRHYVYGTANIEYVIEKDKVTAKGILESMR
jgi:integrase